MPRAVAPLFVAAVLILIVGAIIAGVRFGDDGGPVAIQPTETTTDGTTEPGVTDTDTATETESPSPSPTETDTGASPSPTATDTGASPSPTETGTSGQAQPGETESPSGTASPTETASPSDDRTPIALDDMPDTGGGAAAALAGFVVLTGAAGLVSRRR